MDLFIDVHTYHRLCMFSKRCNTVCYWHICPLINQSIYNDHNSILSRLHAAHLALMNSWPSLWPAGATLGLLLPFRRFAGVLIKPRAVRTGGRAGWDGLFFTATTFYTLGHRFFFRPYTRRSCVLTAATTYCWCRVMVCSGIPWFYLLSATAASEFCGSCIYIRSIIQNSYSWVL